MGEESIEKRRKSDDDDSLAPITRRLMELVGRNSNGLVSIQAGESTLNQNEEKEILSIEENEDNLANQKFIEKLLRLPRSYIEKHCPPIARVVFASTSVHINDKGQPDISNPTHTQGYLDSSAPVVCVRHAISCANYAQSVARVPTVCPKSWGDHEWKCAISSSRHLSDCPLHPYGLAQTDGNGPRLHNTKFHTVLVSPLRRTLQTCNALFRNHPDRHQIRFLVFPWLREWIRHTDGVPISYKRTRFLFGTKGENDCDLDFDWSYMEKFIEDTKRFWTKHTPQLALELQSHLSVAKTDGDRDEVEKADADKEGVKLVDDIETVLHGDLFYGDWWLPASVLNDRKQEQIKFEMDAIVLANSAKLLENQNPSASLSKSLVDNGLFRLPDTSHATYSKGLISDLNPMQSPIGNAILSLCRQTIPAPYEDYNDVINRAEKTKQFIEHYRAENRIAESSRIGIVSHHRFLDSFYAVGRKHHLGANIRVLGEANDVLKGGKSFANCEIAAWPPSK